MIALRQPYKNPRSAGIGGRAEQSPGTSKFADHGAFGTIQVEGAGKNNLANNPSPKPFL
jgi:hypothetical protein